jgi:chromate reductase, NAD(P)H dehydrogenase (quinone)
MADLPRILALAGSARTDSFNKRLMHIGAAGARATGAEVTMVNFRDFELPMFDQDGEARDGLPVGARQLKQLFNTHQGLLIASPEYNSSISPLLKNAIDWVSRLDGQEPPLASIAGKTAVIMSASPGALGGLRGLRHLREILSNIQVLVLPDQIAIVKAHEAFQPDGSLKDPKQQAAVEGLGRKLVELVKKLTAA